MRYDVVIATLNRPESLKSCLSLLEKQTEIPRRVIIVDASDDHQAVHDEVMRARDQSIEWMFIESDVRSSPRQRNLGLAYVDSDIVLLPDDDSMLYPNAAEEMLAAYRLDVRHEVGGVSGVAADRPPTGRQNTQIARSRQLKERVQPLRNRLEDIFVTKPFNSYPRELWSSRELPGWVDGQRFVPVETIGGYLLSLRAEVVKRHPFDEVMGYGIGYALHEDMELSLRLQRSGYLLVAARQAPIFHDVHPSKRAGGFNYGFCWIANYLYACRRDLPEESPAWREHLPRFLAYKLALYRARAQVRRDEYSREVWQGAQAAWQERHELMSADGPELPQIYRDLCDRHIRH